MADGGIEAFVEAQRGAAGGDAKKKVFRRGTDGLGGIESGGSDIVGGIVNWTCS